MKNNIQTMFIMCVFLFSGSALALPTAKVTVHVLDEVGAPVEDAKISVYFTLGVNDPNTKEGETDETGMFEATGNTIKYVGSCYVTKDGYYPSVCNYSEKNLKNISGIMGFRRWEPWNPTITVVLKKIKNPIALYMRDIKQLNQVYKITLEMPEFKAGYDLVESDWVVPNGKGTHADFILSLNKNHIEDSDFRDVLTVTFTNPDDGIQSYYTAKDNASIFKTPYHAPLNNYQTKLVQIYENDPNKIFVNSFREDQNYFFRIRTEVDDKGNVISALYGKIEGNIKFGAPAKIKTAWLKFKYFLNPTSNDTNLEFDKTKNLFGDKFSKRR